MTFWDWQKPKKSKGLFGKEPPTSFACCTSDDKGICYAGGANSFIYLWYGNVIKSTLGVHGDGFVGAIKWYNDKLYSGGKDGRIVITDTNTMQ